MRKREGGQPTKAQEGEALYAREVALHAAERAVLDAALGISAYSLDECRCSSFPEDNTLADAIEALRRLTPTKKAEP
jgi:hypothetical protein